MIKILKSAVRSFLGLSVFIGLSMSVSAQTFQTTEWGVKTTAANLEIEVKFYDSKTVRIIKLPAGNRLVKQSLAVTAEPVPIKIATEQKGSLVTLSTDDINVSLDLKTGNLAFATRSGAHLLKEKVKSARFTALNDAGHQSFSVSQSFVLDKGETLYGLGQQQNGKLNQRGLQLRLEQSNHNDAVPFIQSVKGYGIFWDNYSPSEFLDQEQSTTFKSDVGDEIDYYFLYGQNSDGVIAAMRRLTGEVPMFPLWSYGYWQSKERYKSQAETVAVVAKHRELGVPLDGIIQDWQYWGNNYLWNAMDFLSAEFPDGKNMIQQVHDLNAHLIISIWSSFGPQTKQYRELNAKGMLLDMQTWPESGLTAWPPNKDYPSGVKVYDAFHPEARDIYWKYAKAGLYDLGVDGWWMDSTEPDHINPKPSDYDFQTHLGSFKKVRNAYPLMTVGGVYDRQREADSDKRVFILTRSAFAGQQRYGANTWSGDVTSTWESLRNQIPAALNFSLTGIPHWNSDIGGFFAASYNDFELGGTGTKNALFQELYVRWLQFGAFTPMMRSHGTDLPREIYQFGVAGEPIYDAIAKFIHLRYALLPYIYSTSWEVTNKQSTFMRALFMDFIDDKNVWDIDDQYMFGRALLVAPILKPQYTYEITMHFEMATGWNKPEVREQPESAVDFTAEKSADVYLPKGAEWYNFWTNEKLKGGQKLTVTTHIDTVPLYVKAGSIIPFGPKVQFATEKKWDNLEIRVYPGQDGSFVLYEDEFDNYNYEKGAYTEIEFNWDDDLKELKIADRIGSYPGMLETRKFRVLLPSGSEKVVDYKGRKTKIAF